MNFLELIEMPHVFRDDNGNPLFSGTPDRKLIYPKDGITVLEDFKFGRKEVQNAVLNMQLRSYVCMEPTDGKLPLEYHVPSSLLRRKLCPGSWAMEVGIADEDAGSEEAQEGTFLHTFMADRLKDRSVLTPEQLDTIEAAEKIEADFLSRVPSFKPGCTYAMIIQPRLRMKQYVAEYTPEDIQKGRHEIIGIWYAFFRNYKAPRNASADACQFCRAKAGCPEFRAWAFAVERFKGLPMGQWTVEQWNVFLERRGELQKFLEQGYEYAKQLKAVEPEALPDWELKEGHEVRHVDDIVDAYQILHGEGLLDGKQFSQCCELSIGDVERVIWKAAKATPTPLTQKKAKELLNRLLAGIMQKRKNKPSLVKTNE